MTGKPLDEIRDAHRDDKSELLYWYRPPGQPRRLQRAAIQAKLGLEFDIRNLSTYEDRLCGTKIKAPDGIEIYDLSRLPKAMVVRHGKPAPR